GLVRTEYGLALGKRIGRLLHRPISTSIPS
ncbi:hypothetical protein LCGC14_2440590, partial [marine sediment metagenome]